MGRPTGIILEVCTSDAFHRSNPERFIGKRIFLDNGVYEKNGGCRINNHMYVEGYYSGEAQYVDGPVDEMDTTFFHCIKVGKDTGIAHTMHEQLSQAVEYLKSLGKEKGER